MDALELLKDQLESKSLGKIAKELDVSKTSLCLIRSKKYPNPQKMYKRIMDMYGSSQEIIGISVDSKDGIEDIVNMVKEIECMR
ncbi:MAG: hypothetical protein C0625_10520 [Arcobacter sp.]|nr:MAG: hypothetical protein C0625_10520 [Arcobacter sp.]